MIIFLALIVLFTTHFWRLTAMPGLHFDEAFAARMAARIATEPGFWPIEAQSPFTSAWSHWVAALGFRLGGTSLATFRSVQMIEVGIGLVCLSLAVGRKWGKESALWFLPMVSLIPGLFLNHRFAIELTGFHVLCFGAMMLGLAVRKPWIAVTAAVFGVWSHVIFLAPVLAVLAQLELQGSPLEARDRRAIVVGLSALLPFFFRVALQLPHDMRPKAFVVFVAAGIFFYGLDLRSREAWKRFAAWRWWGRILPVLAIVWWVPALFFAEGHWMVLVAKGDWQSSWILPALMIPAWWVAFTGARRAGVSMSFLALLAVTLGVMIPKPTPRYFELLFLSAAALGAVGLARSQWRNSVALLGLAGVVWMFAVHYQPGAPVEKDLRFLFFKDSSTDFLSKQEVASFLGSSGCGPSDIRIADYRGGEGLRFLAESGGWKAEKPGCRWPQAILRRALEVSHGGKVVAEVAGFVLEK